MIALALAGWLLLTLGVALEHWRVTGRLTLIILWALAGASLCGAYWVAGLAGLV